MKLTETIDECIEFVTKEITVQKMSMEHYPEFIKTFNEEMDEDEKLDEEGLAKAIDYNVKEGETNILKWEEHLNNLNHIKDKMQLEE